VGIADKWSGNAQDLNHWRDTHFRIEGPAVAQMQAAFMDNRIEITGDVLHGEDYFPRLDAVGTSRRKCSWLSRRRLGEYAADVRIVDCGGDAIDYAIRGLFRPGRAVCSGLCLRAGLRRVGSNDFPGPLIDMEAVRRASRARWGDLLRAGVEI
jgi:cardiolipin synthase A/B